MLLVSFVLILVAEAQAYDEDNRTVVYAVAKFVELTSVNENDATFDVQMEIDIAYPTSWPDDPTKTSDLNPQFAGEIPFVSPDRETEAQDAYARKIYEFPSSDNYTYAKYL